VWRCPHQQQLQHGGRVSLSGGIEQHHSGHGPPATHTWPCISSPTRLMSPVETPGGPAGPQPHVTRSNMWSVRGVCTQAAASLSEGRKRHGTGCCPPAVPLPTTRRESGCCPPAVPLPTTRRESGCCPPAVPLPTTRLTTHRAVCSCCAAVSLNQATQACMLRMVCAPSRK